MNDLQKVIAAFNTIRPRRPLSDEVLWRYEEGGRIMREMLTLILSDFGIEEPSEGQVMLLATVMLSNMKLGHLQQMCDEVVPDELSEGDEKAAAMFAGLLDMMESDGYLKKPSGRKSTEVKP